MTDKDIKRYNAVVIGGGASGLMCACRLAYDGVMGIAVLERNQKAGKKLLMTGNGRCNLTNDDLDIDSYNTDDREILTSILKRYGVSFVKDFFEGELGVMLVSKGSLIYPRTLKSVTVCEALERYLRDRGVNIITDTRVNEIKEGFLIDGEISSSNIIIACGGASYPKTGSDGSGLKL
ncbi:MAG TPA: aminoacetone oxidase family FAD-binding enzyme, partial [Clostridiales bacterium]|nr:aminoacetone oxidase family FAD-binding enzyme [Clostridiales bacterium]